MRVNSIEFVGAADRVTPSSCARPCSCQRFRSALEPRRERHRLAAKLDDAPGLPFFLGTQGYLQPDRRAAGVALGRGRGRPPLPLLRRKGPGLSSTIPLETAALRTVGVRARRDALPAVRLTDSRAQVGEIASAEPIPGASTKPRNLYGARVYIQASAELHRVTDLSAERSKSNSRSRSRRQQFTPAPRFHRPHADARRSPARGPLTRAPLHKHLWDLSLLRLKHSASLSRSRRTRSRGPTTASRPSTSPSRSERARQQSLRAASSASSHLRR